MSLRSRLLRPAAVALVTALVVTGLGPAVPTESGPRPVRVRASESSRPVHGPTVFELEPGTTHIAIHWRGHPEARLTAAFSDDGTTFGDALEVAHDEFGEGVNDGRTYGAVMVADGARSLRLTADEAIDDVAVLRMDAGRETAAPLGLGADAAALTSAPAVIPRSGWGADETIRYGAQGDELWTRAYFPLQKLIVHHTAGSNADPNPAATVRAIYRYHAVTQGWGDIGYQYLVDRYGRIYEGRYSRSYWYGATPTADDGSGQVVAGGHALQHNAGTMGIAMMGTFNTAPPTTAARSALVSLLAWASSVHGINPTGSSTFVNPVTGLTRTTMNIAGHRDYNSTGCPGTALYGQLPSIRSSVAAARNTWPGELYSPRRTLWFSPGTYVGYRFNASGGIIGSKSYTLGAASSAPTSQRATIPNRPGAWYAIAAGVWAGYWIQESAAVSLAPGPPSLTVESYSPWRTLTFAAGTYVGRRFNTNGAVVASKSYTLGSPSAAPTTEKSTIPNQPGSWYYITAGVWDGYWIQESAGTVLDDPPPPPPPPAFEDYDPPRTLVFAAGTHVGYQFTPSGAWYASKPYTLSAPSTAPTDRRSEIPGHAGFWYRITAGVWAGWWIQESAAVTLQPAGAEMYAAPQTLWFAPGTYVGHRFDATGAVTATKPYTLEGTSSAPTSMRAPAIPGQAGSWYYITAGVWAGYWIQESASTSLGMPPPPPPPPFGAEIYDPARTLWFAPGTYVGHTFDATGAVTGTKPYTLVGNSSAPTSMRAPAIPGQVGAWYYITAGVWAGYWIQESAGTTLP